jgi:hypothetical protein
MGRRTPYCEGVWQTRPRWRSSGSCKCLLGAGRQSRMTGLGRTRQAITTRDNSVSVIKGQGPTAGALTHIESFWIKWRNNMASSRLSRGHMSLSRYIRARMARTSGSSASISNGIAMGMVAGIDSEPAKVRFWNPGKALAGDTKCSSCMMKRSVGDRCRATPIVRTG